MESVGCLQFEWGFLTIGFRSPINASRSDRARRCVRDHRGRVSKTTKGDEVGRFGLRSGANHGKYGFKAYYRQESCEVVGRDARRGFTLVELLVVIAIIGILVAFCCRRFRPRERRPAAPTAKIGSSKLAWRMQNHASTLPRVSYRRSRYLPENRGLRGRRQTPRSRQTRARLGLPDPALPRGRRTPRARHAGSVASCYHTALRVPLATDCVGGPDRQRMPKANWCF